MPDTNATAMIRITDDSFENKVKRAGKPVLLDFWAPWCGPCHAIAPTLEEIAGDYAGRLVVAKLNIDESPRTPSQLGIRAVPTLMLFKDGEVKATAMGVQPKSKITAMLDEHLG